MNDWNTSQSLKTKLIKKYIVPDYRYDIDDGIFDYKVYGESLFKPNLSQEYRNRDDVILFDDNLHAE